MERIQKDLEERTKLREGTLLVPFLEQSQPFARGLPRVPCNLTTVLIDSAYW